MGQSGLLERHDVADLRDEGGQTLTQGNGTSGTGWNYYNNGYATDPYGPWNVGSGSQELNGTYDMMGNVWEWMESPWIAATMAPVRRAGCVAAIGCFTSDVLVASYRSQLANSSTRAPALGFRVASVPEPGSITLVLSGAIAALLWWKRRR